jgi:hypothetical protein
MTVPTWVTGAEASAITGITVSDAQVQVAQGVIDIYSNRTAAASGVFSKRDLNWLKAATAWQAAWQPAQAGYTSRSRVKSVSQDGLSVTFPDMASQDLAPLAGRALRNLSWKGKRTDRGATLGERPRGLFLQDYSNEASDEKVVWSPMGQSWG